MTYDEAKALVAQVTYRPGWSVECYIAPHSDAFVLRVGIVEPNSEKPGENLPVVLTDTLEAQQLHRMERLAFLGWVYEVFKQRVIHELNEWLRVEGAPLIEPHPEKGWNRGVLG